MKNYVIDHEATAAFHDAISIESVNGVALVVKSLGPKDFIGYFEKGKFCSNTGWYAAFDCLCSPKNQGYNWSSDMVWRLSR